MDALKVQELTYDYPLTGSSKRTRRALSEVNVTVGRGKIVAVLGPNGAGKTTLSRIVSTLLVPTAGSVKVCDVDAVTNPSNARALLSVVFGGDSGLYEKLTATENLKVWAGLQDMPRKSSKAKAEKLLRDLGIYEHRDRLVREFSRGMKQRLHLARGLLTEPKLLVLDEPTVGLDPTASAGLRQIITDSKKNGCGILLTTHDLGEAELLADEVIIIESGKVIRSGSTEQIIDSQGYLRILDIEMDERALPALINIVRPRNNLDIIYRKTGVSIKARSKNQMENVLKKLLELDISDISIRRPTLEEVYLSSIQSHGLHVD